MSAESFRILAAAALVDGHLGEAEKPVLLKAAIELGLTTEQAEAILKEISQGSSIEGRIPRGMGERKKLFRSLVDLVAADGVVEPAELSLVKRLAPQFGLNELEVEDILRAATGNARRKGGKRR